MTGTRVYPDANGQLMLRQGDYGQDRDGFWYFRPIGGAPRSMTVEEIRELEAAEPQTKPPEPGSPWGPLRLHIYLTFGLTLPRDELAAIAEKADQSRMQEHPVSWMLINALRHLTTDDLHDLAEAIAARSGGTYQRPKCG